MCFLEEASFRHGQIPFRGAKDLKPENIMIEPWRHCLDLKVEHWEMIVKTFNP